MVILGRLASSISKTAICLPDFPFLAAKKVEVIPVIILAPLGFVIISPNASFKIPTVRAVVNVLPLVPVTTTIS